MRLGKKTQVQDIAMRLGQKTQVRLSPGYSHEVRLVLNLAQT